MRYPFARLGNGRFTDTAYFDNTRNDCTTPTSGGFSVAQIEIPTRIFEV